MKFTNFSHKTPHLKGKQHQLDPNLDLKQLVHHATVKYVDRDADGDVDVYDNPKKNTPDENPKNINFGSLSKKLIDKQKGEIKHTKRGMAYENVNKNLKGVDMQAEEKRYCPICDKREGRSECSYGEKVWDKVSVKDEEYSMVRSELKTMSDAIKRLQMKVGKGEGNLEAWVQSKITKAADYIDTAADYVVGGEIEEACWVGYRQVGMKKKGKKMVPNCVPEQKIVDKILDELSEASKSGDDSLHDWFAKSKSSDGKPGWVQLGGKYAGKPCAKQEGQTTKPKCGSSKMAAEMSPEEEEKAARRKRKKDPNPDRVGKAINVATEEFVDEDACKEKVKSRYKVWPSAYASGALVKCRKVGAANWGNNTNEDVTIEDLEGNTFAEVVDLIIPEPITGFKSQVKEATRLQADTGNIIAVILSWRGKTYSVRMFFPQVGMPNKNDITTEIQKIYPSALVLQYKVSSLQPGMPLIQVVNSKSKNYLLNNKTIGEEKIEEEGPVLSVGRGEKLPVSKGAGLTAKGREKYNRETGSNLQAPVTGDVKPGSKPAQRRKNFCSRSRSWKGERGLAARRRWKC